MDSVCYMCGDTHKVKPTSAAVYLVMFGHMGPTRVGQETRERAIKLFRVGPHFVHRKWHPLVRIELEHGFHPKN